MARIALAPGEHSPIEASPYDADRRSTSRRAAAQWRARSKYRRPDGTTADLQRWAKTKAEAIAKVEAGIADLRHAHTPLAMRPGMPFPEAAQVWRTQIARPESGLSAKTQGDYVGLLDRHILAKGSTLRGLTLAQVNDVQALTAFLQDKADNVGTQTAISLRTVLSNIIGMAVKRGVLPVNACRSVGRVSALSAKASKFDRTRALTRTQRDAAIAASDARSANAKDARARFRWATVADLMAFMAGTGCRIAEARALRWDDLDLKAGRVHIRGTKTEASDRMANLPEWLGERLKARHGLAERSPAYVFCPHRVTAEHVEAGMLGNPPGQSNLARWVRTALDDAGLPWAIPHTFRRTVASDLHSAGVPAARIADQLGQADIGTLQRVYLGRDLQGDKADLAAHL